MNTKVLKATSALLIGAILIASFQLIHFWHDPPSVLENRKVRPWQPDLSNGSPEQLVQSSPQVAVQLARPIFSPTRRPFVPDSPQAPPPPPQPEPQVVPEMPMQPTTHPHQFQLKGTLQKGTVASALISTPELPDGLWLTENGNIMGWKIAKIGKNAVILQAGSQEFTLQQYVEKSPAELGTAPPN